MDRSKQIFKLSQGEYVAPEKVEMAYRECLFIQQVFVDGDALSSFPVAIVVPEPAVLYRQLVENRKQLANGDDRKFSFSSIKSKNTVAAGDETEGDVPSLDELCKDPDAKATILADLKRLGEAADLKGFEKVRVLAFYLLFSYTF